MDEIVYGSVSQPYSDYLCRKIELEEAAAQSETLRALRSAIRQHRQILERRHAYIGKTELMSPMR